MVWPPLLRGCRVLRWLDLRRPNLPSRGASASTSLLSAVVMACWWLRRDISRTVAAGSTRTTAVGSTTAVAQPRHPCAAARPFPPGPTSLPPPPVLRLAVLSLPLCTDRCGRDPETGSLDLPPPGGCGSSVVVLAVATASQWVSWCLASGLFIYFGKLFAEPACTHSIP
jgi:hypothetical protein